MAHIFAQPHQYYNYNIEWPSIRSPEIELNGNLTPMEIKKPHASRLVGGVQMRTGWSLTHMWWIKIWEGYLRSEKPPPHRSPCSPGFQFQEDKSQKLLDAKTSEEGLSGRSYQSPKQFLLKNPHTDWPTQTYSLWTSTWRQQLEGTSGIHWNWETEVLGIKSSRGHCPFSKPSPDRASKLVSHLRLHLCG